MKTLHFSIQINASAEKVWNSLWEPINYSKWTTPFCEGSYYKTARFTEGSRIHLLTPSGEGMYSILDKIVNNSFLAFRHLGWINNFEEQPITDEVKAWTNAMETYQLKQTAEGTELVVSVDTIEEYIDHMNSKFPLALSELKRIAES